MQRALIVAVLTVLFAPSGWAVKIELPPDTLVIEAEAGEMDGAVTVVADADASGGEALDHPRGDKTLHDIDLPSGGDWYVWIRIFCPNGDQDSYWMGIDGADPTPPEDALGENGVRIYSAVGDSVNIAGQPFNIWFWDAAKAAGDPHSFFAVKNAGAQVLWSKGREDGTLIDQILLTLDETFSPEVAASGGPIDSLLGVEAGGKLATTWADIRRR